MTPPCERCRFDIDTAEWVSSNQHMLFINRVLSMIPGVEPRKDGAPAFSETEGARLGAPSVRESLAGTVVSRSARLARSSPPGRSPCR